MSNVEKLRIWDNAVNLSVCIYKLTKNNNDLKHDFSLKDQLQRASVSIASNIAEWSDRNTPKEFARFLYIARGSCSELKTQIVIIYKLGYLVQEEFKSIYNQTTDLHKMLNWLLKKVLISN